MALRTRKTSLKKKVSRKSAPSRSKSKKAAPKQHVSAANASYLQKKYPSRGPKKHVSRANEDMSLTDLQFLAKSKGIPFGGLRKTQLINKINNY